MSFTPTNAMILHILVPSFVSLFHSYAKLQFFLRAREKQGVVNISKTERDSESVMSSTPTNVMILHTLVPLFAFLLHSLKNSKFSRARPRPPDFDHVAPHGKVYRLQGCF